MLTPTSPTTELAPDSPASDSYDPARAAEIRRQLRALALALFTWTTRGELDEGHSTAQERMMARVLRPWIPKLRDALLSRLSSVDPAGLEALLGASATALESIIYHAPGAPAPRMVFRWRVLEDGSAALELEPYAPPPTDG